MSSLMVEAPIAAVDPFADFERNLDSGDVHYLAGIPRYEINVTRDAVIAGIIGGNPRVLASQLSVGTLYQGTNHNPINGEQPGQIHHQVPDGPVRERDPSYGYAQYNACDTTPLFLIGAEGLERQDPESAVKFLKNGRDNLLRATEHIISMVGDDNLYRTKPPEGSTGFPFRVTMWKDSIPPHTRGKEDPVYPIAYSQTQFIAARGLLSASRVLGEQDLADRADEMFRAGIAEFMQPGSFGVYLDGRQNKLEQESSDEMHALAFIPTEYADLLPLSDIQRRAKALETPYGYVCTPPDIATELWDKYHGDTVWPVDQAMIHYGTNKFGLTDEASKAAAIAPHINEGQEHFDIDRTEDGKVSLIPAGCSKMLWSVAARELFSGNSYLASEPWL